MDDTPAPKRLLIIDDDESIRELFNRFMSGAGFAVEGAEDGEAGLAKVLSFKPDLIVLDMMLPKLNGQQVIHRLQDMGLEGIPVVLVTGFSYRFNEEVLRKEPNVVDYATKPVRFIELAARIKKLLSVGA